MDLKTQSIRLQHQVFPPLPCSQVFLQFIGPVMSPLQQSVEEEFLRPWDYLISSELIRVDEAISCLCRQLWMQCQRIASGRQWSKSELVSTSEWVRVSDLHHARNTQPVSSVLSRLREGCTLSLCKLCVTRKTNLQKKNLTHAMQSTIKVELREISWSRRVFTSYHGLHHARYWEAVIILYRVRHHVTASKKVCIQRQVSEALSLLRVDFCSRYIS